MKFHIALLEDPTADRPAHAFRKLAAAHSLGAHRLVADPEEADVILFTQAHMLGGDWRLRRLQRSPLAKRFPDRSFVYDERDRPWPAFPGVYVSLPRQSATTKLHTSWGYYTVPALAATSGACQPDLLFSFIGSPTAACRIPLFQLKHERALVERVDGASFVASAPTALAEQRKRYAQTIQRSRFVLCPRGHGTSSIRLFETLAAGRVPVIISDDWVAPEGPHWEAFALRWPEGKTEGLVETLEAMIPRWPEMATQAQRAHREFFADDVSVRRIFDRCAALREGGAHGAATTARRRVRDELAAARWRLGLGYDHHVARRLG